MIKPSAFADRGLNLLTVYCALRLARKKTSNPTIITPPMIPPTSGQLMSGLTSGAAGVGVGVEVGVGVGAEGVGAEGVGVEGVAAEGVGVGVGATPKVVNVYSGDTARLPTLSFDIVL